MHRSIVHPRATTQVEVGQIAVIQPLIPTGCCCAAGGCTISSKIEMNSDKCDMDDDEKVTELRIAATYTIDKNLSNS